jgi:hypothetical protein
MPAKPSDDLIITSLKRDKADLLKETRALRKQNAQLTHSLELALGALITGKNLLNEAGRQATVFDQLERYISKQMKDK